MQAVKLAEGLTARWCYGVAEEAAPAVALDWLQEVEDAPVVVFFLKNSGMADAWRADFAFLAEQWSALGLSGAGEAGKVQWECAVLPPLPDLENEGSERRSFELECDRSHAMSRLLAYRDASPSASRLALFTTPGAFFAPCPEAVEQARAERSLEVGGLYSFTELVSELAEELGYDNEAVCETPGQFAVRGGLVDVYPINGDRPYRLDFFGDELESIRAFDPTTQRSLEEHRRVTLSAITSTLAGPLRSRHILDYFGPAVNWVFHEPRSLAESFPGRFEVFERLQSDNPSFADLIDDRLRRTRDAWLGIGTLESNSGLFEKAAEQCEVPAFPLEDFREIGPESQLGIDRLEAGQREREAFLRKIDRWKTEGETIKIVLNTEGEANRLREILGEMEGIGELSADFLQGPLRSGFRWERRQAPPLTVVTGNDLFGRYRARPAGSRKRLLPQRSRVDQLLDFSELVEGDFLVHLSHGICQFQGIRRMELRGRVEEVISLGFEGESTLHLPLHMSHLLTRYVGLAKVRPKLGRLGGNSWEKTRRAAETATLDFASELLRTDAARKVIPGHAFAPDSDWQKDFENSFIHQETPDQLTAIKETKADMEEALPMDRLVCGDVGFGKTEVALRAVFKAVMDGRQAVILVPTTVLAQQHFNTFRERFAEYPISVEMLSRFRSAAEVSEILRQARSGAIDVLVGTHRLLSNDVALHNLGLLVIDEEHRFGVRHKEKLKLLREGVDVLSMSATPIPRTLYMALMGARKMSVIETPPMDRLPIQTFVKNYDPELVRKAVSFELERGGQVFYLHNRVQTISTVAEHLRRMLPKARIEFGHGQMTEHQLEKIMTRFVAGQIDLLVCTTIIESGLDIPNCNTIIIEGADRFGLAQLYQLRGRVGRFNRQAFAYLLLHRHTRMLDQAGKRLLAMRQHNQLGAGFRIAMRDLELRGAGNLLGTKQAGHIVGVGFDLYCQLLRQSIASLKGEKGATRVRATLRLDFVYTGAGGLPGAEPSETPPPGYGVLRRAENEAEESPIEPVEASFPTSYIAETRLRIDFYRRLALADDDAQLQEIREALHDRFGQPPPEVDILLALTAVRIAAEAASILEVQTEGAVLRLRRASGKPDDYVKTGTRFPRLTKRDPLARLAEIRNIIANK